MEKTVLITGAGRGLGYFLAKTFAENDYSIISHCNRSAMREMPGARIEVIRGDIREKETITKLVELAYNKDLDVLINNAGVYLNQPFPSIAKSDISQILGVNLIAPILLTQAIWPIFKKKRHGLIININSIAGKTSGEGEAIYCASKHGLKGFSDSIQYDATRDGIRVIDVFLGAMQTGMTEVRRDWKSLIDPVEAADMIFNLCRDYSRMRITEIGINRRQY